VGELEPAAQVKLLRVLQDRSFEVLGTSVTRTVDVRVISATNRDLGEAVSRGHFARPPLPSQPDHAPPAAAQGAARRRSAPRRAFPRRALTEQGQALSLARDAAEWLAAQPWPGNVRQLKHLVERSVLLTGKERLGAADFAFVAGMDEGPGAARRNLPGRGRSRSSSERRSRGASPATAETSPARPKSWALRAALYRRSRSTGSALELEGPGPRLPRPPHVALAGLAVPLLLARPAFLVAAEVLFILSLAAGTVLVRRLAVRWRHFATAPISSAPASSERASGRPDAGDRRPRRALQRHAFPLHEERVRQEEQQAFLARVLDASPLGVVTLDLDGRSTRRIARPRRSSGRRWRPLREAARRSVDSAGTGARGAFPFGLASGHARRGTPGADSAVTVPRPGFPRTFFLLVELTEELRLSEKAAYEKLIRMMSHEVNNSGAAVGSLLTSLLSLAPRVSETDREDFTGP